MTFIFGHELTTQQNQEYSFILLPPPQLSDVFVIYVYFF